MRKYYYWKCMKCDRCFISFQAGGCDVQCPCGARTAVTETTKKEYDAYILERLKRE